MSEGVNMEVTNTNLIGGSQAVSGLAASNIGSNAPAQSGSLESSSNKHVKIIKRYQNRKLYDTHQSCYVTLDEISDMIMRGEEVVVIDNRTKKDITSATLTQIIFEKQKRSKTTIPVITLREIIQIGGGTFSGFLMKSVESGSSILTRAKADLDKAFGIGSGSERLRGAFKITQTAAEDLKHALDERAQNPAVSKEAINAAQNQLLNLSNQLNNIEKLIEAAESRSSNG